MLWFHWRLQEVDHKKPKSNILRRQKGNGVRSKKSCIVIRHGGKKRTRKDKPKTCSLKRLRFIFRNNCLPVVVTCVKKCKSRKGQITISIWKPAAACHFTRMVFMPVCGQADNRVLVFDSVGCSPFEDGCLELRLAGVCLQAKSFLTSIQLDFKTRDVSPIWRTIRKSRPSLNFDLCSSSGSGGAWGN